jgi:rare lipoprotein A
MLLALAVLSSGCLHHNRKSTSTRQPPPPTPSTTQPARSGRARSKTPVTPPPVVQGEEGLASWYGRPYHGRKTASGVIYNMYGISAAHRTLPFGTRVKVHDLDNGKDVEVEITDRGPFIEGRVIDLSYGAAKVIHLDIDGIARVRLDVLGYGEVEETPPTSSTSTPPATPPLTSTPPPGIFAVQVGAFRDRGNAERLKAKIEARYHPVVIQSFDRGDGMFHRVRVGQESTEEGAEDLARRLRADEFATETFVIRMN